MAGPAAKVQKPNEPEKHHSMPFFDKVDAKVVAGYVETMHVHNSQKEGPVPEEKRAEYIKEFLDIGNKVALARTEDKVTSTFEKLESPKKQVHPNYVVTNYFKGDTCLESDEYKPDPLYVDHTKRLFRGKKVKIHQFMDNANYVALVAEAGAGKTTAAKRFAQKVLKKEISSLKHIELVHFITFAELDDRKEHTVFDLLFSKVLGSLLTKEAKEYGSLWVQQNPDKILFIMDGLDQVGWTLDHAPSVGFVEPASVPIILQNVLTNDRFLQGCKVLITSREHAVTHFTSDVRPQKTISLTGLSAKDREYLIRSLSGEQGQAILDHLRLRAPGLYSLCETPLFLVFSVAVLLENFENAPETLSGILIRVLVYFLNSENRRVFDIFKILSKLKKLAFDGTNKRRVLFEEKEISFLGLSTEQIHDLVIVTPCQDLPLFYSLDRHFQYLFFCHQSIQEALAALYICDLPPAEFKEFLDRLHDPHFGVVRRIVLGVLLNPDNHVPVNKQVLDTVCDRQEKKAVLGKWLADILQKREGRKKSPPPHLSRSTDMELCSLLNECGQSLTEILPEAVSSLDFRNKVVKEESLFSVSSVISHLKRVETVEFGKLSLCELNLSQFANMTSHCGSIKIKHLQIYNTKDPQVLEPLLHVIEGKAIRVEKLAVSVDDEICDSVWTRLLKFISSSKKVQSIHLIDTFKIMATEIDGQINEVYAVFEPEARRRGMAYQTNPCEPLRKFLRIPNMKLKGIRLAGTYPSPEACRHVGEIVKIARVEDLDLSFNHLRADDVCQLREGLEGFTGQLRKLHVSDNDASVCSKELGEIVEMCQVEELKITTDIFYTSPRRLDGDDVKNFVSSLHKMRDKVRITFSARDDEFRSKTGSVEDWMREYTTPPATCSQSM